MYLQVNVWEALLESGYQRSNEVGVDRREGTHHQAAAFGPKEFLHHLLGLIQFPQRPLRMHMEQFAGLGQDDFSAEPVEQACAQLPFESTDLD